MEIFLKYVAVGLITIMMQIVFSVCWHFGVKTIFENHSEDNATQIYVFLKYFSLLLVAALFALILLWRYIDLVYLDWYHKIGISIFFFYFLAYCRQAMGMLNHLICLLYRPRAAGPFEYDCIWGEFKIVDKKPIMIHDFAKINIDLSKRLS